MNAHELKEFRPSWAEPRRGQSLAASRRLINGQEWLVTLCLLLSTFLTSLPAQADPPKPYAENLTLPAGLIYLPGINGGHLWVSDHLLGFCKLVTNPSGSVPPFVVDQLSCVSGPTLTSAGQPAYDPNPDPNDPTIGFLYVPDNGSKGQGVTRLTFHKGDETLTDPTLLPRSTIQTTGSRAQAVALGPIQQGQQTRSLYVSYGRNAFIDRITNPDGLIASPTAEFIGTVVDRGGPPAMAFVGQDLYLAEAIGVSKIEGAGGCTGGCQAVPDLNLGGAPTFVTSNETDTLYIASLTGVVRATFGTVGCESSYIPDLYVSTASFPFENISALGLKNTALYVGDDRTAGQLVLTGRVWEVLSGPESSGQCGGSAPQPPPPPAGSSLAKNPIVYAQANLTLPAGLVYLPGPTSGPGSVWTSDHTLGLCRLDPPAPGIPTVDNAETIINQSTCINTLTITSPGQTAFAWDPADINGNRGYLYVPDNGAKGQGVYRLTYNRQNKTLGQPQLMGNNQLPKGNRTSAVALTQDGNTLYVVFLKNRDIWRITNLSGAQVVKKIGQTLDRKGPPSIAIVNNTLYLAEAIGVTKISLGSTCETSGNCVAALVSNINTLVPAPTFIAADPGLSIKNPDNTVTITRKPYLFVSDLSVVRRFELNPNPSSLDTLPYATGGKGLSSGTTDGSRGFQNVSAIGVDVESGNLYVGDDLTAGAQLFTGRVFFEGFNEKHDNSN